MYKIISSEWVDWELYRNEFVLDSAADVASLPKSAPGSVAVVADNSDVVYMVNASGAWVAIGSGGSGGGTGGGSNVFVVSIGLTDNGEPKIDTPLNDIVEAALSGKPVIGISSYVQERDGMQFSECSTYIGDCMRTTDGNFQRATFSSLSYMTGVTEHKIIIWNSDDEPYWEFFNLSEE